MLPGGKSLTPAAIAIIYNAINIELGNWINILISSCNTNPVNKTIIEKGPNTISTR